MQTFRNVRGQVRFAELSGRTQWLEKPEGAPCLPGTRIAANLVRRLPLHQHLLRRQAVTTA